LVLIRPIINQTAVNIEYLDTYYPKDLKVGGKIFFIISRVFNDELKSVPLQFDTPFVRDLSITKDSYHPYTAHYFIDVTDIIENYHIAKGYYFEIILRYINNSGKIRTIFPSENRFQKDTRIDFLPTPIVEAIIETMEPHEVTTKLESLDLPILSGDLTQSIMRLKRDDFEGSIKFSRKVVEGIKQLNIDDIISGSNRQEKFKAFLSSSFNLLSNFGEHTGTTADEEEAVLANEIALELSRYIVAKCTI
jgi:hypothetical protein